MRILFQNNTSLTALTTSFRYISFLVILLGRQDGMGLSRYGSGHEGAAVLLPGFAISWVVKPGNLPAAPSRPDPYDIKIP